jgi:hypothetical protein
MKGWRTILFNLAAAILPVMQASGTDLGLTGQGLAFYVVGVNAANILLRTVTNTAVGKN